MPRSTPRTSLTAKAALVAVPLLALAFLTGCAPSADDAEPEQRSFEPAGDRLTISKSNGDLDIRPADTAQIEVTRRFSGRSLIGTGPEATWEFEDDTLTLATDCGLLGQCDVRYEVLVPRNLALAVEGDNGKITATGFDSALEIRTDNGAISVEDAAGGLTLSTENGELRATGLTSGRVDARSESGRVQLSFITAPERVETATDNGAVSIEVPDDTTYKVTTTTDSGDIRTDVPEDPHSPRTITASTDNGAITLHTTG
ncbi:DUF4097 family beta strand repeat-containing protein [Streptomyces sp. MS19]|uniref:DUF4097 family beta strand repeat-containing protein n=1 Tax=Streptomyces sp. MS19 TaxID=3385972 RepID=UPI0039A0E83C